MPLPTSIGLEDRSAILDTGQYQVAGRHAARSALVKLSVAMAPLSSAAMTGALTVRLVAPVSVSDDRDRPQLVLHHSTLHAAESHRRVLALPPATPPAKPMTHAEYR
jgi:hypothetical protein